MEQGWKKASVVALIVVLAMVPAAVFLVGCGGGASPTPASQVEAYVSSYLGTSYEGALPAATQLILGTLLLEGTPNAVTSAQAKALLPLWQAVEGNALQNQSEINAVLGQIERAMAPDQLSAIAAMKLTQDSLATWAQEHGMGLPQGPGGTPGAGPRGTPGAGGPGEMSPEARETMRAGYESMTDEQRAQLMATMQAGGMPAGGRPGGFGGRAGGGLGQVRFLLQPLIELLTQRAGS
jgi:hypothetical protein